MRKRQFNAHNNTFSFPDGSGVITEEQQMELELFDMKWRLNHLEGKADVEEMVIENKNIKTKLNLEQEGEDEN